MAKNNKSIKARLDMIAHQEQIVEKIGKYLKTKRGRKFVSMLHRMPLKELCKLNNAQFMRIYSNDTKNMNIIKASIQKFNIQFEELLPKESTPPEKIRCQVCLTRDQRKEIIARSTPRKLGFAAQMHAYEEHKMQKFIKKHPGPTERELAQDLFPGELEAGYNTQLWIHREYVRNLLCKIHANIIPRERYYRVFRVYKKNTTRGAVISECENDMPIVIYPKLTRSQLREKFVTLAKAAKASDNDIIKMKLYDKYGNLHLTHTFIERKTSE